MSDKNSFVFVIQFLAWLEIIVMIILNILSENTHTWNTLQSEMWRHRLDMIIRNITVWFGVYRYLK